MENGHVLVVEDDDTIRRLLVEYLKQHSYLQVDGARDGVEALHAVSTRNYAVVVLDLMMPFMSGVDFMNSLEAMANDPSIKSLEEAPSVLIITGAAPADVPTDAIEQRFPNFVRGVFRKPLDVNDLADCVERELKKRRATG